MRLFLAVTPGAQLVHELSTALDPWRRKLDVRWTPPEAWHLTLQFLGDWPQDKISLLQSGLQALDAGLAFWIRPGTLGAFPNLKSPRVLFLHLDSDGQADQLAQRIRTTVDTCWPEGPQDKKPFRAHLTLARVRQRLGQRDVNLLQEVKLGEFSPFQTQAFKLVASELRPQGAQHTELGEYPLKRL